MSWTIYDANGTGAKCDVQKLEYSGEFMGERFVTCSVKSHVPIDFCIGDYLEYRGERFEINYDPTEIKKARANTSGEAFIYDNIKLNSLADELTRCDFLDYVPSDNQIHFTSLPTFTFYAETINALLERIQVNLDRLYQGDKRWVITLDPEYSGTKGTQISVNNNTVWDALALVNSEFETNFVINGRTITVGASGEDVGQVFKYGKGNGLYEIESNAEQDQKVTTRVRAYGSTKNLPRKYYATLGAHYVAKVIDRTKDIGSVVFDEKAFSIEFHIDVDYRDVMFTSPNYQKFGDGSWDYYGYLAGVKLGDVEVNARLYTHGNYSNDPLNGKIKITIQHISPNSVLYDKDNIHGQETDYEKAKYIYANLKVGDMIQITRGIKYDLWPKDREHITYPDIMPNNMAIDRLMLPGFPEDTLDPHIDSDNIEKYGLREATIFFDGSEDGMDEIFPSIEGMTADEVMAAGFSITLQSGDNGHLDEIAVGSDVADDGTLDIKGNAEKAAFTLKIKDIGFDIKDYLLADGGESISVKSGMCAGREFKITNCVRDEKNFTLSCERITDDSLSLAFPNSQYQIMPGDRFVLLNIGLPDVYVSAASQRLKARTLEWLAKNDTPRRNLSPKIDEIVMAKQHDNAMATGGKSLHDTLREGQIISVYDEDMGADDRVIIDKLVIKEDEGIIPKYEVTLSNEKKVSTIQKIQNKLDAITNVYVSGSVGGVNGIGVDIITLNSPKIETDANVYSARRTKNELERRLSSKEDDTAEGLITLEKGAEFGDFVTGLIGGKGGKIDGKGNGELESLIVRSFLEVPELRFNRVDVVSGELWNSIAFGLIDNVEEKDGYYECTVKLEDGERCGLHTGDICRGIFLSNDLSLSGEYVDDAGFLKLAGFATCYFTITEIVENEAGAFKFRCSTWEHSQGKPVPFMKFAVYGSFTDENRRASAYSTRTYQRFLSGVDNWVIDPDRNIFAQFGNLEGLTINGTAMHGYGSFQSNVYFKGFQFQLSDEQKEELKGEDGIGMKALYRYSNVRPEKPLYEDTTGWRLMTINNSITFSKVFNENYYREVNGIITSYYYYQDNPNDVISMYFNVKSTSVAHWAFLWVRMTSEKSGSYAYVKNGSTKIATINAGESKIVPVYFSSIGTKKLEVVSLAGIVEIKAVQDVDCWVTFGNENQNWSEPSRFITVGKEVERIYLSSKVLATPTAPDNDKYLTGFIPRITNELWESDNYYPAGFIKLYTDGFCYKALTGTSTPPTNTNYWEMIPTWSDKMSSVSASMPYIYMAERKRNEDGTWGDFSTPVLFASYGKDGADGADGADGDTPIAKKDTDGKFYWWVNGTWMLDESGNKIPARGEDGDGKAGALVRFRGEWNAAIDDYVYNDEFRDVVTYKDGKYIVYKQGSTVPSGRFPNITGSTSDHDTYWQRASQFNFVAADTALVDNAHIGGFTFNYLLNSDGSKKTDANGNVLGVLRSQSNSNDGTPTLSLNSETGELIADKVKVRGIIDATRLTIKTLFNKILKVKNIDWYGCNNNYQYDPIRDGTVLMGNYDAIITLPDPSIYEGLEIRCFSAFSTLRQNTRFPTLKSSVGRQILVKSTGNSIVKSADVSIATGGVFSLFSIGKYWYVAIYNNAAPSISDWESTTEDDYLDII